MERSEIWEGADPQTKHSRLLRVARIALRSIGMRTTTSAEQILPRKDRLQRNALLGKVVARAFQAVHDGDDLLNCRAPLAHGTHGLHHRTTARCHVLDQDDRR